MGIRRVFWRFLLRTLTPLIAVTAIAWSAFAMNPTLSAKRTLAIVSYSSIQFCCISCVSLIQGQAGCFAANVLFHMVVNEFIAKVSYVTKLDIMIYGCYMFNVRLSCVFFVLLVR